MARPSYPATSATPRWCWACGAPDAHRHHIVPRHAGGGNRAANLIELCARCHRDVHRLYRALGLYPEARRADGTWARKAGRTRTAKKLARRAWLEAGCGCGHHGHPPFAARRRAR
jgi:5-methylcytosine-specific restriction endonuclease McrA